MGNAQAAGERELQQRAITLKQHDEDPRTLWMPQVQGADAQCGCTCCCKDLTVYLEMEAQLPPQMDGIMTYDEYIEIGNTVNGYMESSYIAPGNYFPLLCLGVCIEPYLRYSRKKGYRHLLEQLNEKWKPRNVAFFEGNLYDPVIVIGNTMTSLSFQSFFIMKWMGPLQATVEQQVVVAPATSYRPMIASPTNMRMQ